MISGLTRAFVMPLLCLPLVAFAAPTKNGFDLSSASIPVDEILPGGPPRDGIPAIDAPVFLDAKAAADFDPEARVLGVARNGVAKAYPVGILNWHEIVNDRFGDEQIVVTFCPLCGTGMAFEADVGGAVRSFGVSGLLHNSDVLLYDRETDSLWSQIARAAVSGPMVGTPLVLVPTAHTNWSAWKARYSDSLLLSEQTGHRRNYARNPYGGYETSTSIYFPVSSQSARFHPKEQVIGLELNGVVRAYPFSELARSGDTFAETVGDKTVTVEFDAEHRSGRVLDASGQEIPTVIAFWFAWYAFHPDGEVFTATE
jgi:hypothetical protein